MGVFTLGLFSIIVIDVLLIISDHFVYFYMRITSIV